MEKIAAEVLGCTRAMYFLITPVCITVAIDHPVGEEYHTRVLWAARMLALHTLTTYLKVNDKVTRSALKLALETLQLHPGVTKVHAVCDENNNPPSHIDGHMISASLLLEMGEEKIRVDLTMAAEPE